MTIDNGANIVAGWTKFIAISSDGSDWTPIEKSSIKKISPIFIPNVRASVVNRGYKHQDSAKIHVEYKDGAVFTFDVQDVQNQASWVTPGAATVQAGLNKAISDITTWLSL